jgi:hypothetical protein
LTRDLKKLPKKYLWVCLYLSLFLPVDTHTNQLKNTIATELVTAVTAPVGGQEAGREPTLTQEARRRGQERTRGRKARGRRAQLHIA